MATNTRLPRNLNMVYVFTSQYSKKEVGLPAKATPTGRGVQLAVGLGQSLIPKLNPQTFHHFLKRNQSNKYGQHLDFGSIFVC